MTQVPEDLESAEATVQADDTGVSEDGASSTDAPHDEGIDPRTLLDEQAKAFDLKLSNVQGNISQQLKRELDVLKADLKQQTGPASPLNADEQFVFEQAAAPIVERLKGELRKEMVQTQHQATIKQKEAAWIKTINDVKSKAGSHYTAADETRVVKFLQAGLEDEAQKVLNDVSKRAGQKVEETTQKRRRAGTGATPARGTGQTKYQYGKGKNSRHQRADEMGRTRRKR
jgi:hypothetical protein|tara:strand:- start:975 stop:1661 length:687 start_codon:yes stop_codon:yes gene_type:complete